MYIIATLILLLFCGVHCARPGVRTLSVQRPQPHTTNPQKERKKNKTVRDKKERADHASRKALALLLKSKETQRWAQSFCDTEKSHNEEARTSTYEQPKHHE